jgi:hypothetical protein
VTEKLYFKMFGFLSTSNLAFFGQNYVLKGEMGLHLPSKCLVWVACLFKVPMFQREGMKGTGLSLPPAFQYFILMIWRSCDLNLVISSLPSKCQDFKLRGLQHQSIKWLKNRFTWSCHKNQISKKLVGVVTLPPSFATRTKHFDGNCK